MLLLLVVDGNEDRVVLSEDVRPPPSFAHHSLIPLTVLLLKMHKELCGEVGGPKGPGPFQFTLAAACPGTQGLEVGAAVHDKLQIGLNDAVIDVRLRLQTADIMDL